MLDFFKQFMDEVSYVFFEKQRYLYIVNGLKITVIVTLLALALGLLIGILVAVVRTAHDQIGTKNMHGLSGFLLRLLNEVTSVYLTVIRGTPVMVQLLLMYFVFLVSSTNKVLVAVLTFGINSGAYVAEIFRSGIMSIDRGQMEAGRSLGLGYGKTMQKIILPQAIKNVLPALVNEMITLLKETSICGYIGLNELTRGGDIVRGNTFDAMLPLLTVAAIYLVIVMFFTWLMGRLERRLRESDNR